MGDLADLRRLAAWSARSWAPAILLVNPLHAPTPGRPAASPARTSPQPALSEPALSARRGGAGCGRGGRGPRAAGRGRACAQRRAAHRPRCHFSPQDAGARAGHGAGSPATPAFDRYCHEQGEALRRVRDLLRAGRALRRGTGGVAGRVSPSGLARGGARSRPRRATASASISGCQWLLDGQLGAGRRRLPVMQDLPIGVDPDGADAWAWQDVLAADVTVGAPPDEYNTLGQDWGLPPVRPLAPARRPATSRSSRPSAPRSATPAGCASTTSWVCSGCTGFRRARPPPAAPTCATRPMSCSPSSPWRASARRRWSWGRTSAPSRTGSASSSAARGLLSYRLLWFETEPPARYPELALAAVTTHDLPTVAGLWTGADLRAQREIGLAPNEEGLREIRERLRRLTGATDETRGGRRD